MIPNTLNTTPPASPPVNNTPAPPTAAGPGQPQQAPSQQIPAITVEITDTPEKIHTSFESALLKSLPVSSLERILAERGFDRADLDTLRTLDALLQSRGAAIDPSSPAQVERLEQWLRLALDNPKLAEDLVERLPVLGAREVAERLKLVEILGAGLLPKNIAGEIPAERIFQGVDAGAGTGAGLGANAAKLLEELCRRTFSETPAKLIEIVRMLDALSTAAGDRGRPPLQPLMPNNISGGGTILPLTPMSNDIGGNVNLPLHDIGGKLPSQQPTMPGNISGGVSLPNTPSPPPTFDARLVLGEILNKMMEQVLGKTELLHDAKLLSAKSQDTGMISPREAPKADLSAAKGMIQPSANMQPAMNTAQSSPSTQSVKDTAQSSPNTQFVRDPAQSSPNTQPVRDTAQPSPSAQTPLTRGNHPVPPNLYDRIISEPRFSVSPESKNAVFSQINAAREAVRQAVDGGTGRSFHISPDNKGTGSSSPTNTARESSPQGGRPVDGGMGRDFNVGADNKGAGSSSPTNITRESSPQSGRIVDGGTGRNFHVSADSKNTGSSSPTNTAQGSPQTGAAQASPSQTDAAPGRNAPDPSLQAARSILAQIDRLQAGFRSAFSSLELHGRVSPFEFSGDSVSSAVRQSFDSLRVEILLDASRALQEVFSSIGELRGIAEMFFGGTRAPSEAESAMFRAAEVLARQARLGGDELTEALRNVLRELSRVQTESMRADGQALARATPAEVMRFHAQSAAGGLENLQLLAANARGPDNAQQQVFALPVKMGQEWTEVQVKFIKKRGKGGKEKAGDGRVSVYLNVSPSALGEVTAHLDFHPPASLKLSFQFEKPEATKWFKDQSGALREALSNAGLPGAALEFHNKRAARKRDVDSSNVRQDIAGVRSDGKVDFRV